MKKIILLLIFMPFFSKANYIYVSNVSVITPNVIYSMIGIQYSGYKANSCIKIDSVNLKLINNTLFFIINTSDYSCINPNVGCMMSLSYFNDTVFLCPPPNMNGTYYMKTIEKSYCPSSFGIKKDTLSFVDTVNVISATGNLNVINISSCNNYILNNDTILSSGIYNYNITCDSFLSYNIKINQSTDTVLNITDCNSFNYNGQNYLASGTYFDTLINYSGCDSNVKLILILNSIDKTVNQNGATLTSNEYGANYQWLNCPNFTIIPGATNQSFNAVSNGEYAVSVTKNNCNDTSSCYIVSNLSVNNLNSNESFYISPNPTNSILNVTSQQLNSKSEIIILNTLGQIIFKKELKTLNYKIDISTFSKGIYYVEIITEKNIYKEKLIKN